MAQVAAVVVSGPYGHGCSMCWLVGYCYLNRVTPQAQEPSLLGYPMNTFSCEVKYSRLGADLRSAGRPLNLSAARKDKELRPIWEETCGSLKVQNVFWRVRLLCRLFSRKRSARVQGQVHLRVWPRGLVACERAFWPQLLNVYSHDGFVVCERAFWPQLLNVYSHDGFVVCERAFRPRLLIVCIAATALFVSGFAVTAAHACDVHGV